MVSLLKGYPNLLSIAQRAGANTGTVLFASSIGATGEAIQLVDQQIAAINYAHVQGSFSGAEDMAQAITAMKTTAEAWPTIKSAITAAAQETVNSGPAAASLGDEDDTVQQMTTAVKAFMSGTLSHIVTDFDSAKMALDKFNEAMDQAYSTSENANRTAADAVTRDQEKIESKIKKLQAQEDDLTSAGSVILGIITLGITTIVKLNKLKEEAKQLRNEEQEHQYQLRCYQVSLASFNNALSAIKLADYALSTLSTSLQQSVNSVNDIAASTSDNFIVMQAELRQFKTEFSSAVTNAQKFTT